MSAPPNISSLLHEAGETHHRVYRIADGADDDWASFNSDWLIRLSELPDLLSTKPVPSEPVYLLVKLDKDFGNEKTDAKWEDYYAERLLKHFAGG